MSYNDIILTNLLFNSISKIDTGYFIVDTLYMLFISTLIFYILKSNFKQNFSKKIESISNYFDKTNKLIFASSEKATSQRYRAIMYYISRKNDPTIKTLSEVFEMKYSHKFDDYEEKKTGVYRVNQSMKFNIDTDIYGRVYTEEKEKKSYNNDISYVEISSLEIFSKKLRLTELEDWVESRLEDYEEHLQMKACDKQLLFEISYNTKEKDIDVNYNNWESNVTFENRFFTDKHKILDKINFFINNSEWYKERGIPYTLGFLLWGEPGCGKTGFIKALMNLTGRHSVSIKLNNKFDMNKLREIVYDDMISDFKIPQNKRILIFEDIDCMGDIVKERDDSSKEKIGTLLNNCNKKKDEDIEELLSNFNNNNNYNNNLSYLLNILDGLQECPGRIIIMTTNKPQELDKALIRPGRIDYNINFTKATCIDIKNILEFYWKDLLLEDIPESLNNLYSHAMIVNMCRISISIEETYQNILESKKI